MAIMKFLETMIIRDLVMSRENADIEQSLLGLRNAISGNISDPVFLEKREREFIYSIGDESEELLSVKNRLNSVNPDLHLVATPIFDYYTLMSVAALQYQLNLNVTGNIDEVTYVGNSSRWSSDNRNWFDETPTPTYPAPEDDKTSDDNRLPGSDEPSDSSGTPGNDGSSDNGGLPGEREL